MAENPITNPSRSQQPRRFPLMQWIGNRELPVLLALFGLLLALWAFAELADEVTEGETLDIDQQLLLGFRTAGDLSDPVGPGWVEEIGRDITALGGVAILAFATLGVSGYLIFAGRHRVAVFVLVAGLGALAVSTGFKELFDRDRPELVPHGSMVYTSSFPSGHSMMAASIYLTLGALLARVQKRKRLKAYILILASMITLMVGISRVYLGVHWPTDVLAGWTLGAGWALLCWLVASWLQLHGRIETEEDPEPETS